MWSRLGALRVGFVVIALLMITASCSKEDGEVALLMSFKKSLVSSVPNNSLSDWTSDSASPCSWRGVSCTGAGLVNTLNLTNAGLIGTLHLSTLSSLNSLRHIFLHGNSFTLGNFTVSSSCTLETLDLSTNNFSGMFPFIDLLSCHHLTYLNVSQNFITGSLPSSLANFTQLQVLDLSSNSFTGNIPSRFCPSALENILLSDNYLSGKVPAELGGCKNLSTINLSFNNLTGQIPLEIWSLPNLSNLVLWANNLTGEIPEGICVNGSGNLETLILNNNFISGSIPHSIGNCTNMIWMSLTSNHITGEIPASVGNLNELAILELGNNLLTGKIPPELGKCKSLVWLDLSSNKLIGSIPSELANQAGLIVPGSVVGKQYAFIRNMGGTALSSILHPKL